jgi:tRNA-uridine 2-sulfurtransferase
VVVAMSGGVDSSVTAALLCQRGYEVIGIGLRLPEMSIGRTATGACCGIAGMEDARRVAETIGIPFYVLNYQRLFEEKVIQPFSRAYAVGETPNPCIACNIHIKFGGLLRTALALGADYLATGHYAGVEHPANGGEAILRKGLESQREQSYFLYALTPDQLTHLLFPLSHMQKRDVREVASNLKLPVADKPSSQDICFVPGGNYREFLAQRGSGAFQPGPIVDSRGRLLGTHNGIADYTVGQRKGLGIAAGTPLYVLRIVPARKTVVVGPKEETLCHTIRLKQVNWITYDEPVSPLRLQVKTRYRAAEVEADVVPGHNGAATVHFLQPQPAVAPGQATVFYEGDILVGGGVAVSYE